MIPGDFNNANMVKEWSNHYKLKISLGTKILIGGVGLTTLVESYFVFPQFKKEVNNISNFCKDVSISLVSKKYISKIAHPMTVTKNMISLDDYGKKHGLEGIELESWKGAILNNNHYLMKLNPDKVGIDENGKLYPGGIINFVEPN